MDSGSDSIVQGYVMVLNACNGTVRWIIHTSEIPGTGAGAQFVSVTSDSTFVYACGSVTGNITAGAPAGFGMTDSHRTDTIGGGDILVVSIFFWQT